MRKIINKEWANKMLDDINNNRHIDETISFNNSAQFLIKNLSISNIPFKVYNLGAGVKRISTDTNTCPCCFKDLN